MALCMTIIILAGGAAGLFAGFIGRRSREPLVFLAGPIRGFVSGAILGMVVVLAYGCPWSVNPEYEKSVREGGYFLESEIDFKEFVLDAEQPALVDFFSPTCAPCRKLSPIIGSLKSSYSGKAGIYKIDVTVVPEVAEEYEIRAVPTVVLFDKGKEAGRILGYNSKSVYSMFLDGILRKREAPQSDE